ncbi:uncharacterized protein LOC109706740 [Ananas comosus]|uniref:Uncharacterized protein LOC109706740 n=1 Tax=Ananas comosus TaxID=4615 RepID=A0A6P5EPS9_ANACO|nr:uncharacterized protein LOC109706740 [Ananas comosus]
MSDLVSSSPREDAVTHLTSFVSRYSHKIKNLLKPHPEHGQIQFHRLNIKNGSQPEGLIKMTDLSTSSTHRRSTVGSSSTNSTSRTTPDSRTSSRCRICSNWPPFRQIRFSPFSGCLQSTSSTDRRSTAGSSSTYSTSRTTPDSRASSRCRIW